MGNREIKDRIWISITSNDQDTLKKILTKHPEFLNEPISSDNKTNALIRSAYLNRSSILSDLILLGAEVDKTTISNISALMWAAAKGSLESLKVLINSGADPLKKGPLDMTALDFAVLFGSYNTAYFLTISDLKPTKTVEKFLEAKNIMKTSFFQFSEFLELLEEKTTPENSPFYAPKISKKKEYSLAGPRNPNDTWGSHIHTEIDHNFVAAQDMYRGNTSYGPRHNGNAVVNNELREESDIIIDDLI